MLMIWAWAVILSNGKTYSSFSMIRWMPPQLSISSWYTEKRLVPSVCICPLVCLNPPHIHFHLKLCHTFEYWRTYSIRNKGKRTISKEQRKEFICPWVSPRQNRESYVSHSFLVLLHCIDSESHQRFSGPLDNLVVVALVGCETLSESWACSPFIIKLPWEKVHQWQGKTILILPLINSLRPNRQISLQKDHLWWWWCQATYWKCFY